MKDALATYRQTVSRSVRSDEYNGYRVAHPGTARRIDAGASPTAAISLHCRVCSGDTHPRACVGYTCSLFPYRPGADDEGATKRRPGDVPTEAQYRELQRLADPDGAKAQAMRERMGWTKTEPDPQPSSTIKVTEDDVEW
jgi:hypothetical protein